MTRPRIGLTFLALFTVVIATCFTLVPAPVGASQVQPSNPSSRKAQADLLNQQGIQLAQATQFQVALQFFQQATTIYQEIQDHQSQGNALGNMGSVYIVLRDYPKAIQYYQQWATLAREFKDIEGERKALRSLGNAYADLGDMARATMYYQQDAALAKGRHNRRP